MRIIYFILIFLSSNVIAEGSDYDICYIAGYFSGSDQDLYLDIAVKEAFAKKVMGTPLCVSAWKDAVDTGKYFSANGEHRNNTDKKIAHLAAFYKRDVLDSMTNTHKKPSKEDFLKNKSTSWLFTCTTLAIDKKDSYTENMLKKGIDKYILQGDIFKEDVNTFIIYGRQEVDGMKKIMSQKLIDMYYSEQCATGAKQLDKILSKNKR